MYKGAVLAAAAICAVISLPADSLQVARAPGATFIAEIGSPSTMRKTSETMTFSPAISGPTLLSWKAARDLKLGTAVNGVFRPSHAANVTHKRRSLPSAGYSGIEEFLTVGPSSAMKHGGKPRPVIDVVVIRTEKELHVTATDARGKRKSARLREICVPVDARTLSLPHSIAGPDITGRFDAAIVGSGQSVGVLWDQKQFGRRPGRIHK